MSGMLYLLNYRFYLYYIILVNIGNLKDICFNVCLINVGFFLDILYNILLGFIL